MNIDLRNCKPGDKLKLRNGLIATYDRALIPPPAAEGECLTYSHAIKFSELPETVADDGRYDLRTPNHDWDVVEIIRQHYVVMNSRGALIGCAPLHGSAMKLATEEANRTGEKYCVYGLEDEIEAQRSVEPGEGWRLLQRGEKINKGDMFYDPNTNTWHDCYQCFGNVGGETIRRRTQVTIPACASDPCGQITITKEMAKQIVNLAKD